jgi:hypothetical protein
MTKLNKFESPDSAKENKNIESLRWAHNRITVYMVKLNKLESPDSAKENRNNESLRWAHYEELQYIWPSSTSLSHRTQPRRT